MECKGKSRSIIQRLVYLLILAVICGVIVVASTFGWRFWVRENVMPKMKNKDLSANLEKHVFCLAHKIGDRTVFDYDKLRKAQAYIEKQFVSFGYSIESQNYNVYGKEVSNIIVTKRGVSKPEKIIIIGAHYDSCANPGADDNASAVAGLLEIARILSNKQTDKTIEFIAFVNEEPPFFRTANMGSKVYAKAAKEKKEDIAAVIILEMIGYYSDKANSQKYPPFLGPFYPNKGNFIAVVGNFSCRWLVKKVVVLFKKATRFPVESLVTFEFVPGVDFSDHWSFWQEGYPAVMITDTAFYRNPNYHTLSDTYDTLDYHRMAEVISGMSIVLERIAE
ncbi:MAG: M20/M25/M40 family metallo-hydrolase [Candidatus Omnitrophota bacterium]